MFLSPGSVGLARAHPLTKTQAMEPSRQTRSSYGPPYPLGRLCLDLFFVLFCFATALQCIYTTIMDYRYLVSRTVLVRIFITTAVVVIPDLL